MIHTGTIADMLKIQDVRVKRQKRALFSAVGMVSRYLFGTLDENDEELKTLISGSNNNTNQVANLPANQTELVVGKFGKMQGKLTDWKIKLIKLKHCS